MQRGNLAEVYDNVNIGDVVGYGESNPLAACIVPGRAPAWYVACVAPAHEGIAAGHLIGRRFGIYLPETEEQIIKRGRRVKVLRPMFPGYLFVFMWMSGANYDRVHSCPGVLRILCVNAQPVVIPDGVIDATRAVENKKRPLCITWEAFGVVKRVKRRWRHLRKFNQHTINDNEIVAVRTWSAFMDGIDALDGDVRNRVLNRALGLPV